MKTRSLLYLGLMASLWMSEAVPLPTSPGSSIREIDEAEGFLSHMWQEAPSFSDLTGHPPSSSSSHHADPSQLSETPHPASFGTLYDNLVRDFQNVDWSHVGNTHRPEIVLAHPHDFYPHQHPQAHIHQYQFPNDVSWADSQLVSFDPHPSPAYLLAQMGGPDTFRLQVQPSGASSPSDFARFDPGDEKLGSFVDLSPLEQQRLLATLREIDSQTLSAATEPDFSNPSLDPRRVKLREQLRDFQIPKLPQYSALIDSRRRYRIGPSFLADPGSNPMASVLRNPQLLELLIERRVRPQYLRLGLSNRFHRDIVRALHLRPIFFTQRNTAYFVADAVAIKELFPDIAPETKNVLKAGDAVLLRVDRYPGSTTTKPKMKFLLEAVMKKNALTTKAWVKIARELDRNG